MATLWAIELCKISGLYVRVYKNVIDIMIERTVFMTPFIHDNYTHNSDDLKDIQYSKNGFGFMTEFIDY